MMMGGVNLQGFKPSKTLCETSSTLENTAVHICFNISILPRFQACLEKHPMLLVHPHSARTPILALLHRLDGDNDGD